MTASGPPGERVTPGLEVSLRDTVRPLRQSPTLAINERVRGLPEGRRPLHMGFGESPFPVHPRIAEALAVNADKSMYLPSAGLPELRALAGPYFSQRFGFEADGYDVVVGPGSKELLFDVQLAVEGDLLLPVPSWVSYGPQAKLLGDRVIPIPTVLERRHHVTADGLERAIRAARGAGRSPTKLILNYPNNPSGLSPSGEQLAEIAEVCARHGILVVSDEIYGLVDHRLGHRSIACHYPEGTVVTTGLSKHLSLGGYRLGIALIPKELHRVTSAVVRIASETWSTVAAPIQFAAVTAFEGHPDVEAYIEECTGIHALVSGYVRNAVRSLGVEYPALDGGFYLYPDFGSYREALAAVRGVTTSERLAEDLIEEVALATLPGTAFGADPGRLTLRLATCAFDGREALARRALRPAETADEFVGACCPDIADACAALRRYFEPLAASGD